MDASAHIKQLIESSTVLSEVERKEWLDLLPFMNDKQQSELLLILQPPVSDTPPTAPPASAPVSSSVQSVPPVSPAPVTPASSAAAVPSTTVEPLSSVSGANVSAPATTVSAFLNKNFASELHRGSIPGSFQPESITQPSQSPPSPSFKTSDTASVKSSNPTQANSTSVLSPTASFPPFGTVKQQKNEASTAPFVPPPTQKPRDLLVSAMPTAGGEDLPEQHEPVINVQSLEAVRMLNVATLRGRGVMNIETELKTLCEKFGYFSVQFAFEQSPLYQAYIAVGARILKDHQTFEEVQAALAAAGRPYLAKPEFEEFSDLLRRLKGHA